MQNSFVLLYVSESGKVLFNKTDFKQFYDTLPMKKMKLQFPDVSEAKLSTRHYQDKYILNNLDIYRQKILKNSKQSFECKDEKYKLSSTQNHDTDAWEVIT